MSATNTELAAFLRTMAEWVSSRGVWTGAEIERFYIAAQRLESRGEITEAEVKIEMPDDLRCEREETDE